MPVTWHTCTCLARVRATNPGFSSKFQCRLLTTTAMRSLCNTLTVNIPNNNTLNNFTPSSYKWNTSHS